MRLFGAALGVVFVFILLPAASSTLQTCGRSLQAMVDAAAAGWSSAGGYWIHPGVPSVAVGRHTALALSYCGLRHHARHAMNL